MILQLAFVLTAIIIGARLGGIGLGVMGGVGLAILTFVFGLQPTAPPIDVMLMIAAVISAASCMQAAGGLDYMVKLAEHLLRKNPSHVTLLSPLVTYLFTFVAGTGHVAYSVLPVIAEVATETKIRPERPLGIAVIASQQAITASPISAATVALLGLLAGFDITLFDILKITIPATIIGVLVGALFSMRIGKELVEDPEYQKRLKEGLFNNKKVEIKNVKNKRSAMISVIIFILATAFIGLFGSFEGMRPSFLIDGEIVTLGMSSIIEIVMLSAAAIILLGIALGISPYMLIALFPAVNGYFFIPNYPTVVAAINFDRTGTTKIGKYVLNHSFMMPGLVSTVVAIALGLLFIQIF